MALNSDTLGQALHDARQTFNDKTIDELIQAYGSLDGVRLAIAKADAVAIISHFKTYGDISGAVATTGTATAQSGNIVTGTGKIN